jgi:hypothetical protein
MRNVRLRSRSLSLLVALPVALLLSWRGSEAAGAQYRRGGAARSSVHRADLNRNVNVNHNTNVTRNVNVNRNVNVHHDVYVHDSYDRWGHPVAAAAVVAGTAIAVGAVVASLPPKCTVVVTNNVTYQNCGGVMYQPVYQGSTVQYVVVKAP